MLKRNRRAWIASALAVAASLTLMILPFDVRADEPRDHDASGGSSSIEDGETRLSEFLDGLDIIDCHTHFYDPSRPEGVPWPAKNSSLYRTVLPENLRCLKQFRPVTGTVVVEASSWVDDNAWLLKLAETDPFIVGIVGRLHPGDDEFAEQLNRFAANPLFRGIRISVRLLDQLLEENSENPASLDDLVLLAERDLSLDVNGGTETPAIVARLAEKIPNLRIVVNHVGNVAVTSNPPPSAWRAGIEAAAEHPNVFCKISALVEKASREGGTSAPDDLEFYRPYLDIVWNAFGDDRVIYASNWPVSERGASYETLQRIAFEYAVEHGAEATRKFASLNAKRAYQWIERPGRRRETGSE